MTDQAVRLERARQEQVRYDADARHRAVWGVPRPPDAPPRRAQLPPDAGRGPGYDLPVEHTADCTGPRVETVGWFAAGTGDRVLVVSRCLTCTAETRRRLGP